MKSEIINVEIAKLMGWKRDENVSVPPGSLQPWRDPRRAFWQDELPSYFTSLDACKEFEKSLTPADKINYIANLWKLSPDSKIDQRIWNQDAYAQRIWEWLCFAPADKRCEAFLKTHGVNTDE